MGKKERKTIQIVSAEHEVRHCMDDVWSGLEYAIDERGCFPNKIFSYCLPKEQGSFIFVSLKHAVLLWTLSLHQEHVSAMISLELNDRTDWNACREYKNRLGH